MTELSLITQN